MLIINYLILQIHNLLFQDNIQVILQENNKKESVSSFDDEKWEKIDNLDEDKTDEGFKITGGLFGGNQDYGDQSDDEDE